MDTGRRHAFHSRRRNDAADRVPTAPNSVGTLRRFIITTTTGKRIARRAPAAASEITTVLCKGKAIVTIDAGDAE
ncbi:hypothetical protein [Nonomuraea sp. NPDC049784]|uniref:hypothetical protein n=1 Tax=Nonomuraea sp. NPDC049784 TaxID=3154361 RepID=UPI0033ECD1FB